jgi:Ca2+/Na+ antiporter
VDKRSICLIVTQKPQFDLNNRRRLRKAKRALGESNVMDGDAGFAGWIAHPLIVTLGAMAALALGSAYVARAARASFGRIWQRPNDLVIGLAIGVVSALPELFLGTYARLVSVEAVAGEESAIPLFANWHMSLGLVYGSTMANLALVLGLAAFLRPMRDVKPVSAWEGLFLIGAASVPLILLLLEPHIADALWRQDWRGVCLNRDGGLFSPEVRLGMVGFYFLFFAVSFFYFSFQPAGRLPPSEAVVREHEREGATLNTFGGLGALLAGSVLIIVISQMVWSGAGVWETLFGDSSVFKPEPHPDAVRDPAFWSLFGRFFLAAACFLPEVMAVFFIAFKTGRTDLAVTTVAGATMANLLLVLPILASIDPLPLIQGLHDHVRTSVDGLYWDRDQCYNFLLPDILFLPITALAVTVFMVTRAEVESVEGFALIVLYVFYFFAVTTTENKDWQDSMWIWVLAAVAWFLFWAFVMIWKSLSSGLDMFSRGRDPEDHQHSHLSHDHDQSNGTAHYSDQMPPEVPAIRSKTIQKVRLDDRTQRLSQNISAAEMARRNRRRSPDD